MIARIAIRHLLACGALLATAAWSGPITGGTGTTWGSFNGSRINYPGGPLTGSEHSSLRGLITADGQTVGGAAGTLDASYLSGVDVFYTSLLSMSSGVLSGSEQNALHDWVGAGGTLIVTADIFPLNAYESFTSFYGITGYTAISGVGNGTVAASHEITDGISSFYYVTESRFNFGGDGQLLARDAGGNNFMAVFEPATGFNAGGRILVVGDHNMFTNSYINLSQNRALAENIVDWAGNPTVVAAVPEPASLALFGLGVFGMAAGMVRRRRKG